jgi:hypothetical protein
MLLFASLSALGEPSQAERFEPALTTLRSILESGDAAVIADDLAKRGRGPLFQIEGLSRLYQSRYEKTMGPLREQSKALEDRVGKLIDLNEHIEFAKKVGAPDAVVAYMSGKRDQYRAGLIEYLTAEGWAGGGKKLEGWEKAVRKTDWDGPKKDREYVVGELFDLTQEIRKKPFNLRELQTGLHEFRRRTRWLLIYSQALGALVDFDGRPLEKFGAVLQDPVAETPYGKLPIGPKEKFPILLPREVYLELTKAVEELGYAKDTGEAQYEWLPEALLHSGAVKTDAEAAKLAEKLVKKHPRYTPVYETGEEIFERLRANDHRFADKEDRGLLVALKERLKEQIDWSKADCRRAMKGI